jgi:DNA-binding response OmpR family regulator
MHRILILDNDKLIRWSLKEIFSQEGYSVDTAATAGEALNQARNNSYQLIFTDFEIEGENIIEMLKSIREFRPDMQIIILSALPKPQVESKLGELTVNDIIEKPFKSEDLLSAARKALHTSLGSARK